MRSASGPIAAVAFAGVVVAAATGVVIARAPDRGVDLASMGQGLAYGFVMAACPIGVLLARHRARAGAALGGGMVVAGALTLWGGNFPALLMFLSGAPLALAAWNALESAPRGPIVRQFLIASIALVAATYLVLSSGWAAPALGSFLAGSILLSSLWDSRTHSRDPTA